MISAPLKNGLRRGVNKASSGVSFLTLSALLAVMVLFVSADTNSAHAQRPTPDRVAGIVSNGTDGVDVPEEFGLSLLAFKDGNIVDQETVTVGPDDGTFEFTDLIKEEGVEYRLAWEYGGVTDQIFLVDEPAPQNLPVVIYESTDSLENIQVTAHATIIPSVVGSERLMGVLDLVTLRNTGDRTFVPDASNPNFTGLNMVRFSLPEGYSELAVDSVLPQGQLLEINTGFAMTNPVPPGDHEILYSYAINYSGRSLEFTRTFAFGAEEVRVLIPPDLGTVVAEGMEATQTTELGETVYKEYAGTAYEPGFKMNFVIEGLPQPGLFKRMNESIPGGNVVVFGFPALIAVAMIALVLYVLAGNRRRNAGIAVSPEKRLEILQQIVELDEQLEAGEIDADQHQASRDSLTSRALAGMEENVQPDEARDAPLDDDELEDEDDPASQGEDPQSRQFSRDRVGIAPKASSE